MQIVSVIKFYIDALKILIAVMRCK